MSTIAYSRVYFGANFRSKPNDSVIRATQHKAAFTFQNQNGVHHGDAGDWEADGGGGDHWIIKQRPFPLYYEKVANQQDTYKKRVIVIDAVPVKAGDKLTSLEGAEVANPFDWKVTGLIGESYFCPHTKISKAYEPADDEAKKLFTTVDSQYQKAHGG